MLLLLLVAAAQQPSMPDVRVLGPGRPNDAVPATLVVEPAAMLIVACDADGDGRTTRAELDRCLAQRFPAGGSMGYLAYADWQKQWLGDQGALPSPLEVDRNGDDRITLDELQAQFARLFARLDKDGDGAVTRAEALTIRAYATGEPGQARARGRPIPGGRPPERPPAP